MEKSPAIIELRDAAVEASTSGGRRIVRNLNWSIAPGDCWVVGGLAGSGKTVLLETAAGLRPPAAGVLMLFGARPDRQKEDMALAARRRLGFVYGRGGRLLSHLTLSQNIALPLCYHRNCAGEAVVEEVAALLEQFGLLAVAERLPGQVNPASRQRAALVRALALRPEVLFLDDPLGELNATQSRWWTEFVGGSAERAELPWRPPTRIVATDDLRPWLGVAQQFALIQAGTWRVVGGREELANTREPFLRELLAETPAPG